jgi:hypothetical protein
VLIIRKGQLQALAEARERAFQREMVSHLRAGFPDETEKKDDAELLDYVLAAFHEAKKYQCTSKQDLCRFLNLTMFYGLDFADNETNRWMHDYLMDNDVPDPAKRLELLWRECVSREEIEEHNRQIYRQFMGSR